MTTRRYPPALVAFAVALIVVLMALFAAALKAEEVCGATTPVGASCTWPGFVAAGTAQGQGYRVLYGVVQLSQPFDIDPEYYVDPAGMLPMGFTFVFVNRIGPPGIEFPYEERLLLDAPRAVLDAPRPRPLEPR